MDCALIAKKVSLLGLTPCVFVVNECGAYLQSYFVCLFVCLRNTNADLLGAAHVAISDVIRLGRCVMLQMKKNVLIEVAADQ